MLKYNLYSLLRVNLGYFGSISWRMLTLGKLKIISFSDSDLTVNFVITKHQPYQTMPYHRERTGNGTIVVHQVSHGHHKIAHLTSYQQLPAQVYNSINGLYFGRYLQISNIRHQEGISKNNFLSESEFAPTHN